ncbi:Uncharacterized protein TPAR_00860 [Tolypocladium paradoxum]|uniref:NADAR domain-containing protein n=1 Tax=Tolypocladium paradoxum TaxID=94208 RepID=A0A2S4L940_9HYPO|nr:Uncharacterized protein TPAR_00860 [Tolypocladium paradoxum]
MTRQSTGHPPSVKALGRKVANFAEPTRTQHREAVVRRGNAPKFTAAVVEDGFRMGGGKEMLLRTGEHEIVGASPCDAIWVGSIGGRICSGSSRPGDMFLSPLHGIGRACHDYDLSSLSRHSFSPPSYTHRPRPVEAQQSGVVWGAMQLVPSPLLPSLLLQIPASSARMQILYKY